MNPKNITKLSRKIDTGIKNGVKKGILDHKKNGRPIWIMENSKLKKIEPEEIKITEN